MSVRLNALLGLSVLNASLLWASTFPLPQDGPVVAPAADPLGQWTARHGSDAAQSALLQAAGLVDVEYGNGSFVAVGKAIVQSPDGRSWTERISGTTNPLAGIGFGGGQFIAVGARGTIVTSRDGAVWTAQLSPTEEDLLECAYGDSRWAAVAASGTVVVSADGLTWSQAMVSLGASDGKAADVTFGNGLFVLAAQNAVFTSVDGRTWTRLAVENPWGRGLLGRRIAFGGGRFVVGAMKLPDRFGSGYQILTSTNLIDWSSTATVYRQYFGTFGWHEGVWVHLSTDGSRVKASTSPDARIWTEAVESRMQTVPEALAAGDGTFVAVGSLWTDPVLFSQGGRVWQSATSLFLDTQIPAVARGPDAFVAITANGLSTFVLRSTDGIRWTAQPIESCGPLVDVEWGGGRFVTIGGAGTILTSTDGRIWARAESGTTEPLTDVTFGEGRFVAAGAKGTLLTSADGSHWTGFHQAGEFSQGLVGFGTGQNLAIFTGCESPAGCVDITYTSPDGVTWQEQTRARSQQFHSLAAGASGFVGAGNGFLSGQAGLAYSDDGRAWTAGQPEAELSQESYRVAYARDRFIAIGRSGSVWSSRDGKGWTRHGQTFSAGTEAAFDGPYGISYGLGTILAVGSTGQLPVVWGLIFQSAVFVDEPPRLAVRLLGAQAELSVTGAVRRTYQVEYKEALVHGSWQPLGVWTSTTSPTRVSDATAPSGAARFYRAVLLP